MIWVSGCCRGTRLCCYGQSCYYRCRAHSRWLKTPCNITELAVLSAVAGPQCLRSRLGVRLMLHCLLCGCAAAVAAYGCLKALNTLLDAVAEMKHLLPTLEDITFGIMSKCISSDGQDVLEDVLQLLAYFTYFGGRSSGAVRPMQPFPPCCCRAQHSPHLQHLIL